MPAPAHLNLVISGVDAESALIAAYAAVAGATLYLPYADERAIADLQQQVHAHLDGESAPGPEQPAAQASLRTDLPADQAVWFVAGSQLDPGMRAALAGATAGAPTTVIVRLRAVQSLTALVAGVPGAESVTGLRLTGLPAAPLAEVVAHDGSAPEAVSRAAETMRALGLQVVLSADRPGLIVDRMLSVLGAEAARCADGGLQAQHIDRIVRASTAADQGPFELAYRLGSQRLLETAEALFAASYQEPRLRPHPLQGRLSGNARDRQDDGAR